MGIQFLKYISEILQIFSLILWCGSLMAFVLLFPGKVNSKEDLLNSGKINSSIIHKFEYLFIFAIIFLWAGILIHLVIAPNNPLKSKLYILHILLSILISIITFIKIFWIQQSIIKYEKRIAIFSQDEFKYAIKIKIELYWKAYYFLSLINLLIISIIILLNQYRS